jgi:hypothetical protein
MRNKANFSKSQMFITVILTTNYNEKLKLDTWSKQTQSKPNLPTIQAGKFALSVAERPVQIALSAVEGSNHLSILPIFNSLCV